ncbi:hypothetical protein PsorP6_007733 [Peronosclerospora sorghi]|uniref:Uncharacterized protein n=1 Tax=Peronosclerospora sorghi TaxID=230839 RepID=A0ACC0WD42_9STRA|nr:hypothetical protein PsorP6_007733 [Peronosclerospora sorghi]
MVITIEHVKFETGDELLTLEGHKNVVYAIAFNNPYWTISLRGHSTRREKFGALEPISLITHSVVNPRRSWVTQQSYRTSRPVKSSIHFKATWLRLCSGNHIITGSFDHTVKVWDVRSGGCHPQLTGHYGEISNTQFNNAGELCISRSIDQTYKVWDVASRQSVQTLPTKS